MKFTNLMALSLLLSSTLAQAAPGTWTCSFTTECLRIRGSGYEVLESYTASATHQFQGSATVNAMIITSRECNATCSPSSAWCAPLETQVGDCVQN